MAVEDAQGVDVYWLPYCTTCQKAVKHLEEKGVPVRSFRNLKEEPLSVDEVRDLAAKVGSAEKLFSKRAMKYRKLGLHEQTLSDDDLLRLMSEEYTFVTRPVIVRGERATAGFSAKRVDELLGA
ncbi:MAG TPA: arsenate reductase family protein [Longimicrobium sp.]